MRQIGLVGGLSWVSTAEYYRLVNTMVRDRLGGHRSARVLLDSVDEQDFIDAQADDPSEAGCEAMMVASVARLQNAGAEVVALCANGLHRFAPAIQERTGVGVLDIADATARAVAAAGIERVGLLGVHATMEGSFYPQALARQGIETLVPEQDQRDDVHQKIIDELTLGVFTDATKAAFLGVCTDLAGRGAQGVILGCTEIPLLLAGVEHQAPCPLFSTTEIHCAAIVDAALTS